MVTGSRPERISVVGRNERDFLTDTRPVEGRSDVSAAMAGDEDALRRVWNRNRNWVAAILLAHKPRSVETDDLLQVVALKMVERLGDLRDERAFRPWLRTVAINAARAAGRRHQVEAKSKLRLIRDCDEDVDDGVDPQVLEQGRALLEMACELPDGYREPLLLRCVKGMSHREIAKVLELPETTIETRIARGRRMLRELASRKKEEPGVDKAATCEGVVDG
jgi:RNA polymerase sigma-70 factor, ECF subfamily